MSFRLLTIVHMYTFYSRKILQYGLAYAFFSGLDIHVNDSWVRVITFKLEHGGTPDNSEINLNQPNC